jgi:hypothetical protein
MEEREEWGEENGLARVPPELPLFILDLETRWKAGGVGLCAGLPVGNRFCRALCRTTR